jgi:hypothetical protein
MFETIATGGSPTEKEGAMVIMRRRSLPFVVAAAVAVLVGGSPRKCLAEEIPFKIAKIYWEYNDSANDLGVHVSLDAEDWRRLRIVRPNGHSIFEVEGRGAYRELGMTELFFEGAEPSLDEFPLAGLLARFPEGQYEIEGRTVDGMELESEVMFSHAIPDGPAVSAVVGAGNSLVISWTAVTGPPPGFPVKPIHIVGYQVIVGLFLVTVPATTTSVTVPPEFVASLDPGVQPYEVLAIEASANQTLTEGTFELP